MGLLWGVAFHWVDLVLLVGLYVVCAFGTTIGFHRYFTHRGFETRTPGQGDARDPRLHDDAGPAHAVGHRPPQAPRALRPAGRPALAARRPRRRRARRPSRGFVHAHVGWLFTNLGMEQGRGYGKDLYEDRLVRTIDRLYLLWVVLTLGIPFAIGYAVGGTLERGLEGLVWGGLVRIFLYQHATFSVNSICHMFGRQDYRSRDEARNNWLVALLVFGEGWHNNHHAFPASARHGLHRGQFDVSLVGDPRARAARPRLGREGARRRAARRRRRLQPAPA